MMGSIYLPTLHTFAMENTFTGSCGMFRFKVTPQVQKIGKEVDFENSSMQAEFWHGLFCYEKSVIEGCEIFPMNQEGREALITWLENHI